MKLQSSRYYVDYRDESASPAGSHHLALNHMHGMDIYLVRHGESTGNQRQAFMGWSDHPLTPRGRAQATAAAARLAAFGPAPVLCSDLARARETAEIIAATWDGAVEPDPRWRELHAGLLEDRPWDEFSADAALTARFDADPYATPMPGGESVAMVAARVTEAFTALRARPEARVIVVTHGAPIRVVLAHCLQLTYPQFWTLAADHGGITRISIDGDQVTIRTVNDTAHLAALPEAI